MREYQLTIRFSAADDSAARVVYDVARRNLTRGAVRLDEARTVWTLQADAAPVGGAPWSRSAILESERRTV